MSHPYYGYTPPYPPQPGAGRPSTPLARLETAAITLGTVGLILCWLPFLDIPVWSLALALALLAAVRLLRSGQYRHRALWAIGLSSVAGAVNLAATTFVILAIAHHSDPCSASYHVVESAPGCAGER
jgi:hypothetical protein